MKPLQKALRPILILCAGFLAVTAIPGGGMLLLGVYAPPVEMLRGSFFGSFVVPGLALAVVVGGTSLLALALLVRRSPWGDFSAAISGLTVMSFEFIQVLSIGSPAGPARAMQLGYFALGILLVAAALLRAQVRSE